MVLSSFLFFFKKKDTCAVISSEKKKKHFQDPLATWKGGPVAVFISDGFLIHCFPLSVDEHYSLFGTSEELLFNWLIRKMH